MKKLLIFFICISSVIFSSAQEEGEVRLIEPIIESPVMNMNQANSFIKAQEFKNWGIEKLGLDSVMKVFTGDSVVVCICDTGKPSHFVLNGSISGSKNLTSDTSVVDLNGHSTHVAGIIHEIAPDADLLFAKVLNDRGFGSNKGVADGVLWCVHQGANIINMSLSAISPSTDIKRSIDLAKNEGVLVIAAAGNNGQDANKNTMGYPARFEETLATGSINEGMKVSTFSSSGEEGDFVAPGEKVLSTWLNDGFRVLSGTSMSAPYASGVAALHYEKLKTNVGVERLFEIGSNDILPEGFDRYSFWGHLSPPLIFELKRDTTKTDPPPTGENPEGGDRYIFLWIGLAIAFVIGLIIFNRRKKSM